MGRANLEGMLEVESDIDTVLAWHLSSNHYPPVPESMIPVCKKAIKAVEDRKFDKKIRLPEGVSYKGFRTAPAIEIFEAHHLDSFLMKDLEEE